MTTSRYQPDFTEPKRIRGGGRSPPPVPARPHATSVLGCRAFTTRDQGGSDEIEVCHSAGGNRRLRRLARVVRGRDGSGSHPDRLTAQDLFSDPSRQTRPGKGAVGERGAA